MIERRIYVFAAKAAPTLLPGYTKPGLEVIEGLIDLRLSLFPAGL